MNATTVIGYTYDADCHCLACTQVRFAGIAEGNSDEYRDSEGNPPHAMFPMDESDTPNHCADCGEFIGGSLTDDGYRYVLDSFLDDVLEPVVRLNGDKTRSATVSLWIEEYPEAIEDGALSEAILERYEARGYLTGS